jgi:hypothetical protein
VPQQGHVKKILMQHGLKLKAAVIFAFQDDDECEVYLGWHLKEVVVISIHESILS